MSESLSVVSDSLQPDELYSPWNSPGQNTGEGSQSLLQGNFLTQESKWGLLPGSSPSGSREFKGWTESARKTYLLI